MYLGKDLLRKLADACVCFAGSLLRALARKLLKLPVSRYCDDYFAADRATSVQHAMRTFARCLVFRVCCMARHVNRLALSCSQG